ncbi:acyl-ACP--UDP-N-acetylglucosamine O-acyltransferase [Planctomycetota bacterium]
MANTKIHPSAVVDKEAVLADDVVIGPNCVVEARAHIGVGTVLEAGAVVCSDTVLGQQNHLHAHCIVGGKPQILGHGPHDPVGRLAVGDRNVFREHVTVHRSMHTDKSTVVGNQNLLMVGSHIGHDCILEDQIVISNACLLGGHCKVEAGVWISGMSGAHQFVTLGKWSYLAGMTAVTHDVPPFLIVSGNYPMRVRGVNTRGVRRAGLDAEVEKQINLAYRTLYRKGGALLENAQSLDAQENLDENVRAIVESVQCSSKHRFNRYLETFR